MCLTLGRESLLSLYSNVKNTVVAASSAVTGDDNLDKCLTKVMAEMALQKSHAAAQLPFSLRETVAARSNWYLA